MRATDIREQNRSDAGVDLDNYNRVIRGVQESLGLTFDPQYFTQTPTYTGKVIGIRKFPDYEGPWAVLPYLVDANGFCTHLCVKKGYFAYGTFRAISPYDYDLTVPSLVGEYVITAELNANSGEVPTANVRTVADRNKYAAGFNYDGLAGQRIIATVSVKLDAVSSSYYFCDLLQTQYGEIFEDRYDPEEDAASGSVSGGPIEWISANQIRVLKQTVYDHRSRSFSMLSAPNFDLTVTERRYIYLDMTVSGVQMYDYAVGDIVDDATTRHVLLWIVDCNPFLRVVAHMHFGAVHIWGNVGADVYSGLTATRSWPLTTAITFTDGIAVSASP